MSRRVLVIDDETNIRRMIRMTLESDGYEVEDAADGQAGLDLYGDGSRFVAIILDQKLPGMDGIETLRQIRRRSPAAAVVMVTAFGSIELAVEAMKAGATDFLKKPLTPDMLRAALLAAISKSPGPLAREAPSGVAAADVWTVNGFFIRALPSDDLGVLNEHRFFVRHAAKGPQGEVLVTIDEKEVSRITRVSGRKLPLGKGFWLLQAERALMNHMFREAQLPAGGRLMIDQLPDEVVLLARDWAP